MARTAPASGADDRALKSVWIVGLAQAGVVLVAASAVALTWSWNRWTAGPLFAIAALAIIGDLTGVDLSTKMSVSGTLLGLMLAAVLLGGAPAALIGMLTVAVGWFRSREAPITLRTNLVIFACFPLASALFFHAATRVGGIGPHDAAYYFLVFPAFLVGLLVNFLGVAAYSCYRDGTSIAQRAREALIPLLSAQLFSAILLTAAVYFVVSTGTMAIAVLGIILVIFQYLVGELLTSQRRAEELQRKATTDELTGLANREQFGTTIKHAIAESEPTDSTFAVMLIDLDHFKEINDTLGHHYGDVLLKDLGPRLAASVGDSGVVARLGGDEFAVLPGERTDEPDTLEAIAARLSDCVQQPLVVDQMTLEVGASIGISRFPLDGGDASALLRRADIAMYKAKEEHSSCKLYEAEMDRHSARRLTVLSDFRRALKSEEFVVHYQPIVEVGGCQPRGAEGLVRWEHPDMGLIPPSDFIPIAEQSGLIGLLTRHVLERAIDQCAHWRTLGSELTVSVNLSVRDLLDRDLPHEIQRLLANYHLPCEALQLEITESMIMSDPDRALATVRGLRDAGVKISVDDFGTGYSSLANLRRLPISELKIDRSFVSPMLRDESDLIIVRSTINLGHDLGLTVIAEGVEDELTLKQLDLLGCDLAQGYHLSRPLTPEAFESWIDISGTPLARVAAG